MADRNICELIEAMRKDPAGFIRACEASYQEKIASAVKYIEENRKKVVLLAGPSGSGKTTTANLLADGLRAKGYFATVISLDNFYYSKEDNRYPLTESGEQDYESPYALWIDGIRATIEDILDGGLISLPRFDFKEGRRIDNAEVIDVPENGVVIIEGLHALNPIMTEGLVTDAVMRVFVSVSTNLIKDGERVLSGRKMRFIRRTSRDYLYRNADAARTLSLWQRVVDGEGKYLYPFRDLADIAFDTFHGFEVAVLKPYASKILEEGEDLGEYVEEIKAGLSLFDVIPSDLVPATSIIREFMSGGIYEHLY
jgi:uridine kinase